VAVEQGPEGSEDTQRRCAEALRQEGDLECGWHTVWEVEAGARERNKGGGECGVSWATHPPHGHGALTGQTWCGSCLLSG